MKRYKIINNVTGWVVFLIAAVIYLLTIEPTASFWDCGEFISTAYKLDVGHPPGAPFFMLMGRMFANFASDSAHVAQMINSMSALFSALTILFLFWSITFLAKKVVCQDNEKDEISLSQIITIIGSGVVGALAYTFSDTFWFSAVEGEVYAFSSLFTAIVFWAILKWEDSADSNPMASDKWIILICYLMGLSIGVHLLNLLCIPALVLVYYYKKFDNTDFRGTLGAIVVSGLLVVAILYGIVPGFVNMAGWFDLFFVNIMGMPYNSGALIYIVLIIGLLSWGLWETYQSENEIRMKIAFCVNIIAVGIPFYGYQPLLWILFCAIIIGFVFLWKAWNPRIMNTVLLCLMVMLIGYSSYGVIVIRSTAHTPMDQNSPRNMFTLESYLNREQYGDRPLLYGQTFAGEVAREAKGNSCAPIYKKQGAIWNESVKNSKNEKDKYVKTGYNQKPVYNSKTCMLFPRMYSSNASHISQYKKWSNFKGRKVSIDNCGRSTTVYVPTMAENLRFFFSYQLNFMYWRYFMWNFSGRQNDIQGFGEVQKGNWITGINFIDKVMVGDQANLPYDLKHNKGNNKYYLLPLILGLIGLFYQVNKGKKGTQGFIVTFFLFFMTGIAIVIYLNQTPNQPRERDYAYAGSFYAFTIWIGLGVAGIIDLLKKYVKSKNINETALATVVFLFSLGVPVLMASQNWDDHDRSNRYTCRDFAYNYLSSCDKNSVIFTNGDNDTFPLWYAQEVEGYRTDVRVCNLSYLQTGWYSDQMCRPYYKSAPLPISWSRKTYMDDENKSVFYVINRISEPISLSDALRFAISDDPNYTRVPGYSGAIHHIPSESVYLKIDTAQVRKDSLINPIFDKYISDSIPISLKGKNYVGKNEALILDMVNHNKFKRPIYFAVTVDPNMMSDFKNSLIQEGFGYKVSPIFTKQGAIMDIDKTYDLIMNKFKWGNMNDSTVYLDENNLRMCRTHKHFMVSLAAQLFNSGEKNKCKDILDKYMEVAPINCIPIDDSNIEVARYYYELGEKEKARTLLNNIVEKKVGSLNWSYNLSYAKYASASEYTYRNLEMLQRSLSVFQDNDKDEMKKYLSDFEKFNQKFEKILESK